MDALKTSGGGKKLAELLSDLNLNITTNPRGTDKGDCKTYVRGFYEREFGPRQTDKNRLLEIGVRSGASVALWANFFKDAEITGIDVEPIGAPAGPLKEYVDYPSVRFFCKDAYAREFADSLDGKFTILIDDGPHSLDSQRRFLELYLSKLGEDGVLVIEDVQRDYRDSYQLMKALPGGDRFVFETYDFRAQTRTGDDFLFVVRHNKSRKNCLPLKIRMVYKLAGSLAAAVFRRLGHLAG